MTAGQTRLEEVPTVRYHRIPAALAVAALLGAGASFAANLPPDPQITCTIGGTITGTHTFVYAGSTAVNPSINNAAAALYGAPLSNCGGGIATYRGNVDTNNDGVRDTCVTVFVNSGRGSCEGVGDLDQSAGGVNVCPATSGATTAVTASSLGLTVSYAASDVSASLCGPLNGGFVRPTIFSGPSSTDTRVFVIPFAMVVNKNIRNLLPASKVVNPLVACPAGVADCPFVNLNLTKDKLKGIYGNNDECDWRYIDPNISDAGLGTPVIGAVMRNRLSGTRNSFNTEMLETLGMGQGVLFESGTGNVITRVNNNDWCGTVPTECGESGSVIGGQTSPCQAIPAPTNVVDIGILGTDRFALVDGNNTPLNPFDDYPVRKTGTDNYDVAQFNGRTFNKASVQCGTYEWWNFEHTYFDPTVSPVGAKRNAVLQFTNELIADSSLDPVVVPLSQMQVSRANDGSPTFPAQPYSAAVCHAP